VEESKPETAVADVVSFQHPANRGVVLQNVEIRQAHIMLVFAGPVKVAFE